MTSASAPCRGGTLGGCGSRDRRCERDDGSVMILLIFLAVILAGVVTVIADISSLFLAQRALQADADAAVAAAAQNPMLGSLYGEHGSGVALTSDDVVATLNAYFAEPAHTPHACVPGSIEVAGSLDGETAVVTLSCDVQLPFVRLIDPDAKHKVSVSSRSRLIVS